MTSVRTLMAAGTVFVVAFSTRAAFSEPGKARAARSIRIPVVGCPSDGQMGHLDSPKGGERETHLAATIADQLAFYAAAQGPQVLGPRGWHCFGLYGSNGTVLFVAPDPFVMNESLQPVQDSAVGFSGAAIQATARYAGTSGRFDVARLIARVFPARKAFLQSVTQGWSADDVPGGPYPKDRLIRRSSRIVEYETPARSKGLGTDSYLLPSDAPIRGAAVIQGPDNEPDSIVLAVRLTQETKALVPTILRHFELTAARSPP